MLNTPRPLCPKRTGRSVQIAPAVVRDWWGFVLHGHTHLAASGTDRPASTLAPRPVIPAPRPGHAHEATRAGATGFQARTGRRAGEQAGNRPSAVRFGDKVVPAACATTGGSQVSRDFILGAVVLAVVLIGLVVLGIIH